MTLDSGNNPPNDSVMEIQEEEDEEDEEDEAAGQYSNIPGLDPNVALLIGQMEKQRKETAKKEKRQQLEFKAQMAAMEKKLKAATNKRSRPGDDEDSEEDNEEPVLIDESVHVKDDAVNVVDLKLRNRLKQVNNDPAKVWTKANGAHDIKKVEPVRGNSIYLEHLMPGRVSAITLKSMHSAGKRLYTKHFLSKNAGIEEDEEKRELSVTKSRKGAIASITPRFEHLWKEQPPTLTVFLGFQV